MRHWLLKPWRVGCLVAGLLVPAMVVVIAAIWFAPGILRWDPPNPGAIAARYRDAMNDADAGDLTTALTKLQALRATDAFNGLVHAAIADVQHRLHRLPDAIAAAEAAVAVDPAFGEAWYNLGCYLVEAGRVEAGLVALHHAVLAGFEAGKAGRGDPDLAPLETDPRWIVYLEGADTLPLAFRTAAFHVVPASVLEGEPVTVTLEVFALNRVVGAPVPQLSVEYLGPEVDRSFLPLAADQQLRIVDRLHARHFVWTFHYRLEVRRPMVRTMGPWEIQLDGVRLATSSPVLQVQPGRFHEETAGAGAGGTAFRPRAFFRIPSPIPFSPGTTLTRLTSPQTAWGGGIALAATMCRSDLDRSSPPPLVWADDGPILAHYDVAFHRPGHLHCTGRVFLVPGHIADKAQTRGVRIRVGSKVETLRASPPSTRAD